MMSNRRPLGSSDPRSYSTGRSRVLSMDLVYLRTDIHGVNVVSTPWGLPLDGGKYMKSHGTEYLFLNFQ